MASLHGHRTTVRQMLRSGNVALVPTQVPLPHAPGFEWLWNSTCESVIKCWQVPANSIAPDCWAPAGQSLSFPESDLGRLWFMITIKIGTVGKTPTWCYSFSSMCVLPLGLPVLGGSRILETWMNPEDSVSFSNARMAVLGKTAKKGKCRGNCVRTPENFPKRLQKNILNYLSIWV